MILLNEMEIDMNFCIGDLVKVTNKSLSTYGLTGVVNKRIGNKVRVYMDKELTGSRCSSITYNAENLEIVETFTNHADDEIHDSEFERSLVTLVLWKTKSPKSIIGAEMVSFLHCLDVEDAKQQAARIILEQPDEGHYWVSINKPSLVEVINEHPTIRKVNNGVM